MAEVPVPMDQRLHSAMLQSEFRLKPPTGSDLFQSEVEALKKCIPLRRKQLR
jgi:hypothetical protein